MFAYLVLLLRLATLPTLQVRHLRSYNPLISQYTAQERLFEDHMMPIAGQNPTPLSTSGLDWTRLRSVNL